MLIYLNGQLIDEHDARVSAGDAGLQHAVGLFETMSAHNGRVFRLEQHLERLAVSAHVLGLVKEVNTTALSHAIDQVLQVNELTEARLRLTMTAGDVSLLKPGQPPEQTLLIQATPPTAYDPAYFENGIQTMIGPAIHNPMDPTHGHKTLNYWQRLRVLRQAATAGAGEAICLNVTNHLAAGCISNVFLVKDGALQTSIARGEEVDGALPAPVLPGVTRQAVLELAEAKGLSVEKKMLSVDELLAADEVFLTNSSWHLLPVTRVEKHVVSDTVGEVSHALRAGLLELIETENSQ